MHFQGGLSFFFAKFIALQLALGIMHGPDKWQQQHDRQSEMKYSSQGYTCGKTNLGLAMQDYTCA